MVIYIDIFNYNVDHVFTVFRIDVQNDIHGNRAIEASVLNIKHVHNIEEAGNIEIWIFWEPINNIDYNVVVVIKMITHTWEVINVWVVDIFLEVINEADVLKKVVQIINIIVENDTEDNYKVEEIIKISGNDIVPILSNPKNYFGNKAGMRIEVF